MGEGIANVKPGSGQLDHLGLAVNNLEQGVNFVAKKTGIDPVIHPAEPGMPYQSASLRIAENSFLEILGPNPGHKGINPLKSLLKSMKEPTLWFWYIGTDDFDKFQSKIEHAGRCIERKTAQEVEAGKDGNQHSAYVRGSIGPGFDPVYPNLIQWKSVPSRSLSTICPVREFTVTTTDFKTAKSFFDKVGITTESLLLASTDSKSYLRLVLETPKGDVEFKSETKPVSTLGVVLTVFRDVFGCL